MMDQPTTRVQHDDLTRTGVRAEAHLGVQIGIVVRRIRVLGGLGRTLDGLARAISTPRGDGDDTARVLAAGGVGQFQRLLQLVLGGGDQQRQHAAGRRLAALLVQLVDLLRYLAGAGVRHFDNHGILQWRPSRASISSASVGPHVPARYGCG